MDFSITHIIVLIVMGILAGIINVLAGGGSNLTLPALMVMGLPADVANATNRLGVFMQSLVGLAGFRQHKVVDRVETRAVLVPTLIGGLLGSLLATVLPPTWLKPLLLGTMLTMSLVMIIRPTTIIPEPNSPAKQLSESRLGWWSLCFAGVYGGFVQAGVGFVLLAALAGTLRYDLVRANALKIVCTFAFTLVSLAVFIYQGSILWLAGIVLSIGTMLGAYIGVKIVINVSAKTLKWALFIMTLIGTLAAMLK